MNVMSWCHGLEMILNETAAMEKEEMMGIESLIAKICLKLHKIVSPYPYFPFQQSTPTVRSLPLSSPLSSQQREMPFLPFGTWDPSRGMTELGERQTPFIRYFYFTCTEGPDRQVHTRRSGSYLLSMRFFCCGSQITFCFEPFPTAWGSSGNSRWASKSPTRFSSINGRMRENSTTL
ncbi:hypothetical protein BC937DRAFT_86727 [Endogone sp. FLAS-F59071]|nr:hypothetical protein BC937DRAFT_86727 [Endogone sp. FLAS-F59071]|eukprot:RUS12908.1 hypothetical protein BC937DRAFT_86727 [Endogone sp. FLAS-F59071]